MLATLTYRCSFFRKRRWWFVICRNGCKLGPDCIAEVPMAWGWHGDSAGAFLSTSFRSDRLFFFGKWLSSIWTYLVSISGGPVVANLSKCLPWVDIAGVHIKSQKIGHKCECTLISRRHQMTRAAEFASELGIETETRRFIHVDVLLVGCFLHPYFPNFPHLPCASVKN